MEKRVFIAVLLSFLILAAYQMYFAPKTPETAAPAATPTATAPATTPPGAPVAPAAAPPAKPAASAPALVSDTQARDIVVETDDVLAVFSTEGGVLKSWKLKKYLAAPSLGAAAGPLDLVPIDVPGDKPFTLKTADAQTTATLAHALYRPSVSQL